jgi:hypothetical protein
VVGSKRLNAMTDVDCVSGAGEGGVVDIVECLMASE